MVSFATRDTRPRGGTQPRNGVVVGSSMISEYMPSTSWSNNGVKVTLEQLWPQQGLVHVGQDIVRFRVSRMVVEGRRARSRRNSTRVGGGPAKVRVGHMVGRIDRGLEGLVDWSQGRVEIAMKRFIHLQCECLFVEHGKELGGIGKENNSARPAVVELVLVAKWNWKEGGREGNA